MPGSSAGRDAGAAGTASGQKISSRRLPPSGPLASVLALSRTVEHRAVTKQKTKKGVAKRMKLTKTGKVKRHQAFTSHMMVRRTRKQKRNLRQARILTGAHGRNMALCLDT
jgi:large subunit ribosomal protein L35